MRTLTGTFAHPAVHAFLAHCDAIFQYEEAHTLPDDPKRFAVDQVEYARLMSRRAELQLQMTAQKPGRNDPCLCGSGLKFKKCCGR